MRYNRRTILLATGGTGLAGLAGCLGGETEGTQDDEGEPEDDTDRDEPEDVEKEELVRTDELEGVNFEVLFVNPLPDGEVDSELHDAAEDALVFDVAMDTHSGDLREFDWDARTSLHTSDGVETDDLEWVWVRESDHHPQGYFLVSKTTADGTPVVDDDTDEITLEISIEDGTAEFTWDLEGYDLESVDVTYQAYVTNSYDGTVSVIDDVEGTVLETVDVAERTSHGIAVTPDGATVYVGDYDDGNVYPISTADLEVGEAIEVGSNAHGVDVDPDGRYLYVSGGSVNVRGDVAVVDLDGHDVVEGIETEGAGHVNFGPEGRYAYVSNVDLNRIAVVDTEEMAVLETVDVGDGPNEAVASPDGQYVYTANVGDDSVSVVDVDTWEEVDRISAGEGTHGIDITPDGEYVWTANRASSDLTVIDAETRGVTETVTDVDGANHLTITPDGSTAYVTAPGADKAFVVDTETFEVTRRIDVGQEPHEIVFA
ncbi:YncE family protein [Natronolimnohabitans sp. A-GB9]|uniref:YncE family protein n=1 Tax=Natronolimnohabitans sp. A-GB9 TaxID=3069757 RepID=UPI0027B69CED|nr:YncE family protein [Natronolimnohabitans sp. A-GB9]MDQ2051701.1 YncE family protein [Natronolimnohabitans sp. A-GB9]